MKWVSFIAFLYLFQASIPVFGQKSGLIEAAYKNWELTQGEGYFESNRSQEEQEGLQLAVGFRPYWYTTHFDLPETAYYGRGAYSDESSASAAIALAWVANPRLRVLLEPGYTRVQSASDSVNVPPVIEPDTYSKVNFDLQLLDVPLLVQYAFTETKLQPFVEGGLLLSVPLSMEVTDEQFASNPLHERYKPSEVAFEEPNFGYTLGLGAGLSLSSGLKIELLARWTQSSSTMRVDTEYRDGPSFNNFRTDMLQAGLRLWWMRK